MAFPRLPFTFRQLFLTVFIAGMVGLTIGVMLILGKSLKAHALQELTLTSRAIVQRLALDSRLPLLQGEADNIKTILETLAAYPNVTGVLVRSQTGQTLAMKGVISTDLLTAQNLSESEKSGAIVAQDQLTVFAPVHSPFSDALATDLYREAPTSSANAQDQKSARAILGQVALTLSLAQLKADSDAINRLILTIMTIAGVTVTVALFCLLELLTRPIKNLAHAMSEPHTVTDFRPVAVDGVRETQIMASAFNALIGTVAQFSHELSQSKAEIERQNTQLTQTVNEQVEALQAQNVKLEEARRKEQTESERKSEFIAHLSHEIRTPLHSMVGHLSFLKNTILTDDQSYFTEMVQQSADEVLHTINSILDFSKLNVHLFTLRERPCALKRLIKQTIKPLYHRARAKQLQFILSINPALPEWVHTDGEQLSRLLRILIDNAIKFTARGRIDVQVDFKPIDKKSMLLRCRIQDSGIGISDADQTKLFQPYMQADSSITREYRGTGLGLTIFSQIVELMRGRKKLTSELGKGTTFYLELPLQYAEPPKESVSEPLPPPAQPLQSLMAPQDEAISERPLGHAKRQGGERVLVVDDDRGSRFVAQTVLRNMDAQVLTAASGAEALSLCEQQPFDLILIDIRMPKMSGFEATRQIRQQAVKLNTRTPIIGLSADELGIHPKDWEAVGMNDCYNKPLTPEKMAEIFEQWGLNQAMKRSPLKAFLQKYKQGN